MADPPRRAEQPPPEQAQTEPPRTQARPAERPAAARPSGRPAPRAVPPSPPRVAAAPVAGPPPEHLRIEPAASANHPTIAVDWRAVPLGSNHSYGCTVTSADGGALTVTVDQGSYQRTLQGGPVSIAAIPPAPEGTSGRLVVRHDASGDAAEFTWRWTPQSVPTAPSGDAPASRGFWGRLFGGRSAAPSAKAAAPPGQRAPSPAAETAASVSEAKATPSHATAAAVPYKAGAAGTFFGQRAVGRRFAFVLDFSGSMAGVRCQTLQHEVENAFRGLPPHAEYVLIGFNSRRIEPPGQAGWTPLGPRRGADGLAWLAATRPFGQTYPLEAFERAFDLGAPPDTIFFVTDGRLAGFGLEDCLRLRGASATVIHTVALDQDPNEGCLQRMAEATGGSYAHVVCPPVVEEAPSNQPPELRI